MAGIGIVNNPRSRRNLRRPETARHLRQLLDGEGEVADASTPDELARVVERFKRARIDVLGVNGGDGTGHVVLTAFAAAYGDAPLPRIVLLRGGSMNTVATAHRIRGTPELIVGDLVARTRAGRPYPIVERDLLRIESDGGPARHGFIFGTGCVVAFLEAYYATGRPTAPVAALLLGRAILSALGRGRFASALTRRERARVVADGEEWPDPSYLTLLAATVPEIGFGFSPFTRCDEQPGFFHAVGITGSNLQVAARLPAIWAGRPWKRPIATDAVTRELIIEPAARMGYTLDGDLYEAFRMVRVSTGPAVGIVVGLGR